MLFANVYAPRERCVTSSEEGGKRRRGKKGGGRDGGPLDIQYDGHIDLSIQLATSFLFIADRSATKVFNLTKGAFGPLAWPTGPQTYEDTKILTRRNTNKQRCKHTEIQTQRRKHTEIQTNSNTNTQGYKHTEIQTHKDTNTDKNAQKYRPINTQSYKHRMNKNPINNNFRITKNMAVPKMQTKLLKHTKITKRSFHTHKHNKRNSSKPQTQQKKLFKATNTTKETLQSHKHNKRNSSKPQTQQKKLFKATNTTKRSFQSHKDNKEERSEKHTTH